MADLLRNRNLQKFNIYLNDFDDEDNLSIKSGVTISSDENDNSDNEAYQDLKRTLFNNNKDIDFKDRLIKIKCLIEKDKKNEENIFKNQTISQSYYSKLLAKRAYDSNSNMALMTNNTQHQIKYNYNKVIHNTVYPIRTIPNRNQTIFYPQETINSMNQPKILIKKKRKL
jgi:hypothetical protein